MVARSQFQAKYSNFFAFPQEQANTYSSNLQEVYHGYWFKWCTLVYRCSCGLRAPIKFKTIVLRNCCITNFSHPTSFNDSLLTLSFSIFFLVFFSEQKKHFLEQIATFCTNTWTSSKNIYIKAKVYEPIGHFLSKQITKKVSTISYNI